MNIAVNISGIRQHLYLIEEEQKKLNDLIYDLNQRMQLAALAGDSAGLTLFRRCLDRLIELEKSFLWRKNFLEQFADDFQKLALDIDAQIEEACRVFLKNDEII